MKLNTITFLICLTFVTCLKLPTNPSPTILIVNHLNYLRYDYLPNPTSLRRNGYSFYDTVPIHRNRTQRFDRYSINRTTNDLDQNFIDLNNLDSQLNGRLDLDNQLAIHQLNNNDLNEQANQIDYQVNYQTIEPNDNRQEANRDLNNNQLNDQQIEQSNNLNTNEQLTNDVQSNDLTGQQANNQDLSNNENLIITNSTEGRERLLELNLLQQTESSLSLVLDADSPFLNNIQVF